MTPSSRRLVFSVLAVTLIVGFSVSLVGCANLGPVTPVAVSDVKSVSGTWRGIVYLPGSERNDITLTIRDDGSYDAVSTKTSEHPAEKVTSASATDVSSSRARGGCAA